MDNLTIEEIVAAFGTGGIALAFGLKVFGPLCDLIKHWLDSKRQGRVDSREDASQIFQQALQFIQTQNVEMAELRARVSELENKVVALQQENDGLKEQLLVYKAQQATDQAKIAQLEEKVKKYEDN